VFAWCLQKKIRKNDEVIVVFVVCGCGASCGGASVAQVVVAERNKKGNPMETIRASRGFISLVLWNHLPCSRGELVAERLEGGGNNLRLPVSGVERH